MIFNIVVDPVVMAALLEVCGPQEDQHGIGWAAGEHNICFNADYGRIVRLNPIWVQTERTAMVRIFEKLGLHTNLSKTKSMVCTPGFVRGHQGVEAYKRIDTGEGTTFQERNRTRVSFK